MSLAFVVALPSKVLNWRLNVSCSLFLFVTVVDCLFGNLLGLPLLTKGFFSSSQASLKEVNVYGAGGANCKYLNISSSNIANKTGSSR